MGWECSADTEEMDNSSNKGGRGCALPVPTSRKKGPSHQSEQRLNVSIILVPHMTLGTATPVVTLFKVTIGSPVAPSVPSGVQLDDTHSQLVAEVTESPLRAGGRRGWRSVFSPQGSAGYCLIPRPGWIAGSLQEGGVASLSHCGGVWSTGRSWLHCQLFWWPLSGPGCSQASPSAAGWSVLCALCTVRVPGSLLIRV